MRIVFAAMCVATALSGAAYAQNAPNASSEQDYMKRVMRAAPPQIVEQATIIRMDGSSMQTLKQGTNEWTCMEASGVPMCLDPNAMEWAHAWQTHAPATDKTGFIYMLAGDTGASNTAHLQHASAADPDSLQEAISKMPHAG